MESVSLDYLAIDFETASSSMTSACSIGLVGVKNDKVVLKEYYLINPKEEFNEYNIMIHHITPMDVVDAPRFDEVWGKIRGYFNGVVVSHNAMFDLSVLKALIEKYKLTPPSCKIGCTLKISQKVWKEEIPNHKLGTISQYLGVEHDYHNALSDAYICYEIIKRCERCTNSMSLDEVMESLGLMYGRYNSDKFYMPKGKFGQTNLSAKENYFKDKVVSILGKPESMTKKKVFETLEIRGAIVIRGIDRSTNVALLFNGAKTSHLSALERLSKISKIDVLNEEEFLKKTK